MTWFTDLSRCRWRAPEHACWQHGSAWLSPTRPDRCTPTARFCPDLLCRVGPRLQAGAGKPAKTRPKRGAGREPRVGTQRRRARARRSWVPFPAPAGGRRLTPWEAGSQVAALVPLTLPLPAGGFSSLLLGGRVPRSNSRCAVRTEGYDRARFPLCARLSRRPRQSPCPAGQNTLISC